MMLDSCLYSSLVAHFLSLFFLEHDAFSGEATPVMAAKLFQTVLLNPPKDRKTLTTNSGVLRRAPLLTKQAAGHVMTVLLKLIT